MQSTMKRELFGGTLRFAGLALAAATSNATAQFVPHEPEPGSSTGNYALITARDTNDDQIFLTWDNDLGPVFPDALNYTGPGGTVSAYLTPRVLGVAITVGETDVWNYAVGAVRQWFTVDQPTEVRLEWDFKASAPKWNWVYLSDVYLDGFVGGVGASDLDGSGVVFTEGAGAVTFQLEPGTVYSFSGRANTWAFSGLGNVSFRLTVIPAPSAITLLAFAAVATRRRRRE